MFSERKIFFAIGLVSIEISYLLSISFSANDLYIDSLDLFIKYLVILYQVISCFFALYLILKILLTGLRSNFFKTPVSIKSEYFSYGIATSFVVIYFLNFISKYAVGAF